MDPAKMKVVDLRSELGALGLDTKGNKPALVDRLKKALEAKTGKAIPDSSILDTSTEGDDEGTPRRAGPAARTRRRSSSSRLAATPAKHVRRESPEPIEEAKDEDSDRYSPQPDSDSNSVPEPVKTPVKDKTPVKEPSPIRETPVKAKSPVREKSVEQEKTPVKVAEKTPDKGSELYSIDDESQSPNPEKSADEEKQDQEESQKVAEKKDEVKEGEVAPKMEVDEDKQEDKRPPRELTEEEEWEQLNERLKLKDQERKEREKQQAEDDAKKLEELANDPIKLNRLKRKLEKKARWNNFYRAVEVTNEVLTPPTEEDFKVKKGKKEVVVEAKPVEPEVDESKIALSWYDCDLNQYLEDDLSGVVPMSEGAFAHTWAGVRATHGVNSGRVCYEVRVGAVITTTESTEKDGLPSGIRVGWSTDDSSLHLGDGAHSWGFESTGRVVNNGEFQEYGKKLDEKDVIGVYLDLESNPCKIFYTVNGVEQGTAFEFDKSTLEGKTLFPHILTKNQCYRVNFGYDRYNMITKTKIVRNRIEIPVEQVLEEKRAREEELRKQKEEVLRKERERREREKKEREERNKKKKEEREKQEKERKEREAQEKRDRGEVVEEDKEKDSEAMDTDKPQENGDKPELDTSVEVKQEPMETETAPEAPAEAPAAAPAESGAADAPPLPADAAAVKEEKEGEAPAEVTEEQVLQGHVLDKRIQFVIRFTVDEELEGPEAQLVPGYVFISLASLQPGPRAPASVADAEVILMIGMPGAGKTHWAKQHCADNPHKRYNILSTGALFDRMKVDCKPFKATYEGRWDAFVSKCAKCVLKLLEMARGRRRNFILDQTNVYPSAQRRKLRDFDGYRRIAVVIVTDEETYKERFKRREEADGKEVPDPAIMDMKANFTLPEKCSYIDEVRFPELGEEEAKQVLEAFHKEAKAAGVVKEKERRERSAGREPPNKRPRDDKRHGRDDRDRSREFRDRDRWGGGGSRWGAPGGGRGGGSRWGGRDTRGGRDGGPPGRFDRWGGPPQRDFGNRDREGFRGGRGGLGGPGGPPRGDRGPGGRGPGGPGGPGGDRGGFNRDNRGPRGMPDKKGSGPPAFGGNQGGGGGGGGSWQRGGQMAQNNRGGNMGMMGNRGGMNNQGGGRGGKDTQQNQGQQQNQQGWNQWAGGWGGWGNWNQNQAAGWGNWGNWGNWNQGQNQAAAGQQGNQQQGNKGQQQNQQQQQQWPANYTAQQWYQWQQWQQQQQQQGAWAGYGQQQANQQQPTAQEAQQAWAQYYQNYGANAAAPATGAVTGAEKK